MTIDAPIDLRPAAAPINGLLTSPILPTLLKLAIPNTIAMFGSVSSASSRGLGAGNRERAAALALHAAMIGACAGLFFTLMMLGFGREFYALLGGRGGVLEQSMQYSHVLFSGAISIWLVNTLASEVRGTGDIRLPSATLIATAIVQIAIGGGFGP